MSEPRMTSETASVRVNDRTVEISRPMGVRNYLVREMPEEFLAWQLESRLAMFEKIAARKPIADFHAHLPVVATLNEELAFPIQTATKATGLLPRDEYLDDHITSIAACLDDAKGKPWEESQQARIAAARRLYEHSGQIDRRILGLVEIFQGQTYRNLARNPLMAMQYTGGAPEYRSYQLNGVVEMIGPGDRRFEFLHLMRQLFEYNAFHVQQPAYPSGYLFWISEVYDKSPRKRAGQRIR